MRCARVVLAVAGLHAAIASATDYHVDSARGRDAPGGGGPSAPFRTLHYATELATSGDRIRLAPGYYGPEPGGSVIELPPGVSLTGAGPESTIVSAFVLVANATGDLGLMVIEDIHFLDVWVAVYKGGPADAELQGPVIRRNRFSSPGAPCGSSVILSSNGGHSAFRVESNRFEGCIESLFFENRSRLGRDAATDASSIVNNVFYRTPNAFHIHVLGDRASSDMRIANNTFIDSGISTDSDGILRPFLENNIFFNSYINQHGGNGSSLPQRIAANVFCCGRVSFSVNGYGASTVAELNQLPVSDPAFPNRDLDPLLADIDAGDLHLLAASPCIDLADGAVAPAGDIDGETRPLGAGADVGADEFAATYGVLRGDVQLLEPMTPALSALFPFGPANPLTPVILPVVAGNPSDPETGILTRPDVRLALYQVYPASEPRVLHAVKDVPQQSVALRLP